MATRKYTIRLYKCHDLDLVTLIETHKFDLVKAVYSALSAFAKNDAFVIDIPPRREVRAKNPKWTYQRMLCLDEQKDAEIIDILSKISEGYRNNFMKNLLRMYLCCPISEDYLVNPDNVNYFYEQFEIFRKGKRVAKAGKMSEPSKKTGHRRKTLERVAQTISREQPSPISPQPEPAAEPSQSEAEEAEALIPAPDAFAPQDEVLAGHDENGEDGSDLTSLFSAIVSGNS